MAEAVVSAGDAGRTGLGMVAGSAPTSQGGARTGGAMRSGAPAPIVLTVENMHCGGCMRKVEVALSAVPGVQSARANLSAKRVTIVPEREASSLTSGELIAGLAAAGFKSGEVRGAGEDAAKVAERDLLYRMAVAGFASANVMLLSVSVWSGEAGGDMGAALKTLFHWLSAMIALPAVAYAGQPFFRSAWIALSARRLNMDVPISLGVLLATGMSLFLTVRASLSGESGHIYFDAAVMLLFFLLIGRMLDTRMRARAAGAASNLIAMQALSADVIEADGSVRRLPAHALVPGMTVQVAAGERIAVDGVVVSGASEVDNGIITGESTPQRIASGDIVHAGAINLSGRLTVRAEAVEANTLLAEIGRLMAAAEQARGAHVRLADRAARFYAPAVHLLGLATFLGWIAYGAGWEPALTAAIAVLIITCPCALALAVPAVQVAATSRLFDQGVIVKAGDGLERLAECDTVVFDKTGTLTAGVPQMLDPEPRSRTVLAAAVGLAASSRHPYARALVAAAREQGIAVRPAEDVAEHPGQGLSCLTDAGEVRLGSGVFCGAESDVGDSAELWFKPANGDAVPFRFTDTIKADARETVARLKSAGFAIEILSGDRPDTVKAVAVELGLADAWRARATPADKVARLEALAGQGRKVLMVGDGLNDAPALALGHASMSPSDAADISQTSADFVFQGAGLSVIVDAIAVARAAEKMSFQNFGIALAYNVVFVPVAVLGFVTPLIAAIAMSASSIAVTGNAVRLRRRKVAL